LTSHPANDVLPTWSHDGNWIYFTSNRSGTEQIWRIPVQGGLAVQMTKSGGRRALESPDGRFVYYSPRRETGPIWRIPTQGGKEQQVPDSPRPWWRGWHVTARGIYFVELASIKFFAFDTRRSESILRAPKLPEAPALTVSPDGRWLLYDQIDNQIGGLMLVENFR
jgi:dipeptidyl aminopeptidase/acylaminoacyl peptidase